MTFDDISKLMDISLEEVTQLYKLQHGVYQVFAQGEEDGDVHVYTTEACCEQDARLRAVDWAAANNWWLADRAHLIQRRYILVQK